MDLDFEELEATRNKSADKMFCEELGYKKEKYTGKNIIFYYQLNGASEKYGIEFDLDNKEITPLCKSKDNKAIYITMQELKAINKKVEELGW